MLIKYVSYTRSHILSYKRTSSTDCNYSLSQSYANTHGYISSLNYPLTATSPKLKVHYGEQKLPQISQFIVHLLLMVILTEKLK